MIQDYVTKFKEAKTPVIPRMEKLGTLRDGIVESTPIVWQDRLLCFEWMRSSRWGRGHDERKVGYYHFADLMSGEEVGAPFAHEHAFGCAHAENGVMYVHGVRGNGGATNVIDVFTSRDLVNWESSTALVLPENLRVFNTSVCRGPEKYLMAVEVDGPAEIIGRKFTILFAESDDLIRWTLLPVEDYIYIRERYSACPSVRYFDGHYYMVYLEAMPYQRYVPYIVRSADLLSWEVAVRNPFMFFDDDDKKLLDPARFTEAERARIANAVDCNNSDVDFCEYRGETYILYSWGNQHGTEFLALAKYAGGLEEFLKSYF